MKKTIITLTILFGININSDTFVVSLDNKHYNNSISISDYTPPNVAPPEPTLPTCDLPLVLNDANDGCINTFDKLTWLNRTDTCQGVRQSVMDSNVYYLRANTTQRNLNVAIPEGYEWMTAAEYNALTDVAVHNYYSKCGLGSAYPKINSIYQLEITFSDSASASSYAHTGQHEGTSSWTTGSVNEWFGIVVRKTF